MRSAATILFAACMITACYRDQQAPTGPEVNLVAEQYVRLALAVGQHDADYVDAYYGPPEWRRQVEAQNAPLEAVQREAEALVEKLQSMPQGRDELSRLRHRYLTEQLRSLIARVKILGGSKLKFDEESRALYNAVPPTHTEEEFQRLVAELDSELPGSGPLRQRYERFRKQFVVPAARLDTVFRAAIAECKRRTAEHIQLPAEENFTVEYVKDKPWGGYNWYQGGYKSLIQLNTSLPVFIDNALNLGCHEGYPGHHVYNLLLEKNLVGDRGWVEFSIYPLFSPQSLIAEGSANYGVELAFPGNERVKYEEAVLFPLVGLDASRAAKYRRIEELVKRLDYAGNEAARRYLDGQINAAEARRWLMKYALRSAEHAEQGVKFFDRYRSYVINYNLGRDLVREYVEKRASGDARRWDVFEELISSPRLPSDLRSAR